MVAEASVESVNVKDLPEIHQELAELFRETVNGGATIGFLPPVSTAEAETFWEKVREALGSGRRLLVARQAGRVVGTVQLDLALQTNGQHRAEIIKLMVSKEVRRQGLGRELMIAAEQMASDEGRTLLVLNTKQGEPSEAFYTALGYSRVGVIPNFTKNADGSLHATVLFYKEL